MSQLTRFGKKERELVNLKDASEWGSQYLSRRVTISNISLILIPINLRRKYISVRVI